MPLSVEQKKEILDLLDEGMERNAIAAQLGVTPGQVSAVKAHRSMGSYDQVEQEPPSPRAEALIQQVRAPIDELVAEANTIQVEDNSDSEDAPVPGLGMAPVAQVGI